MEKVVFIDRDGVINRDLWRYVEHWDEFDFLPGVLEAFKTLAEHDFLVCIVSNQAGVGDGKFSKDALHDINNNMLNVVEENGGKIKAMYYCLHGKLDGCDCRKPETGLLQQAEKELPLFDKQDTFFIGDKLTDVQAGINFGIKTILVKTGYGVKDIENITPECTPDYVVADLKAAVDIVIES